MVRALLVTHGTRGDVQPLLALAVALRRAGHCVLLAAPRSAAPMAAEHGVEFAGLDEGPNRLLDDPVFRQAMDGGYRGLRGKVTAVRTAHRIKPLMADVLRDLGGIARDSAADVVVHTPALPAQQVAELLGVPAVLAALQPGWVPTAAFPCPMLPLPRLPRALNRATYSVVSATLRAYAGIADRWRVDQLGVPRRRGAHDLLHDERGRDRPVLQAFSSLITPVAPDWPTAVRTTGFWFLPEAPWTPPADLAEFLSAGPPPVYLGFGSMAGRDTARTGRVVAETVRAAGVRAVLATGRGGIAPPSTPDVHVVDQAPHQWLFPRTSAVVHHGGVGTTAAALAAGVPRVVCPFVADQPHWAHRAHAAGVAPPPIRQQRLTATVLAEALATAAHDPAMRQRARELGAAIRAEDGVTRAVAALEVLVRQEGTPWTSPTGPPGPFAWTTGRGVVMPTHGASGPASLPSPPCWWPSGAAPGSDGGACCRSVPWWHGCSPTRGCSRRSSTPGAGPRAASSANGPVAVSHGTVELLMRRADVKGLPGNKRRRPRPEVPTAADLVDRDFTRDAPNQLWITDNTEHRTREEKVYCAVVLDAFSRRVVGWSIDSRQDAALVTNALGMAIHNRERADGTVIHSDHGVQGGFNWSSQHPDLGGVRRGDGGLE